MDRCLFLLCIYLFLMRSSDCFFVMTMARCSALDKYTESVYFCCKRGDNMTVKDMRRALGDTQSEFSRRYNIPFRTIQNWEAGINTPPDYVENMLAERVRDDLINRRLNQMPDWKEGRTTLPQSGDYLSAHEWLSAVKDCLGENVVFALDSALMCDGSYLGRLGEWIIWI